MFPESAILQRPEPNLTNYDQIRSLLTWDEVWKELTGAGSGTLNIAHEAVEKHASGPDADVVALRWIKKNRSWVDFTYRRLNQLTGRFANILKALGIKEGDRIFTFTGRIP